ncbi:MAG: hypothetical protein KDD29_01475 [Flavobacteriales bacterium]|nr:hypothetical protein [Flavobacteriales bacterium]MCB9334725.1 hypothetical protein [Flavobacteriales bacterium]
MKKLLAIILSCIILVMSMGFTISSHICGGERVETVIGIANADVSCGMEKEDRTYSNGERIKSNCCQDEFQLVKMEEDYTQQYDKVEFNKGFVAVLFTIVFDLFSSEASQEFFYSDYSPPPLVRDIPVLIQSFLI